ncbi:hypothetical protein [Halobaculum sp. P14]|uniref:hypothetical protein n=1 Tax=Halobaculum sp. P14 TaxID=3421638 RepID=UPI003EC02DCD
MQTLQNKSGSGVVTLPKSFLQRDDVLDDGEIPNEQNLLVDRLGRRVYLVRLVDGGTIPEAEESEAVQRIVARKLMDQDALGQPRTAD